MEEGALVATFDVAPIVRWDRGLLHVRASFPEAALFAYEGRPVTGPIGGHAFASAVVAGAWRSHHGTRVRVRPLAPLAPMPDGSTIGVPDEE